jgi:hypothetical protein
MLSDRFGAFEAIASSSVEHGAILLAAKSWTAPHPPAADCQPSAENGELRIAAVLRSSASSREWQWLLPPRPAVSRAGRLRHAQPAPHVWMPPHFVSPPAVGAAQPAPHVWTPAHSVTAPAETLLQPSPHV